MRWTPLYAKKHK